MVPVRGHAIRNLQSNGATATMLHAWAVAPKEFRAIEDRAERLRGAACNSLKGDADSRARFLIRLRHDEDMS
jgi:hypothetical protein